MRKLGRRALILAALIGVGAAIAFLAPPPGPTVLAVQDIPTRTRASLPPKPSVQVASKPAEPAASPYVIRRVLPITSPMRHGEHHWDDAGVPPGELIITVDLAAQVLSVFRGGYEIGAATILYGADAKPTPLGIYPITQKDADHVSNIYDAPMPYMLRLTNDGVAIHASEVEDGLMTHGCIGVPKPFAAKLFAAAKLGDRVIVTRGERLTVGKPINAV